MSGNRLFTLNIKLTISAEEAVVLQRAYENIKEKKVEIGHIVQEIAQEALDSAVVRYTMMDDKAK